MKENKTKNETLQSNYQSHPCKGLKVEAFMNPLLLPICCKLLPWCESFVFWKGLLVLSFLTLERNLEV